MAAVTVSNFQVERDELTAQAVPELKAMFGLDRLPMATARVSLELKGVPTAIVNGLRRVLLDEMQGHCLQVAADGFDSEETTELFMLPQFLKERLANIPLRSRIPPEAVTRGAAAGESGARAPLQFQLNAENATAVPQMVYAASLEPVRGELTEPLFNPIFQIAVLQPGKRLVIKDIHIAAGRGRDFGGFMVARRAVHTHLDLEQHPREETHAPAGAAVDQSGYKQSSLVADPRHHRLSFELPATADGRGEAVAVLHAACANIRERLRAVQAKVESGAAGPARANARAYSVTALEGGLYEAVLQAPGETHTIGEMLRRAVYDLRPGVSNVAYVIVAHENLLRLSIRDLQDPTKLLKSAIEHCSRTFEHLQRGVH